MACVNRLKSDYWLFQTRRTRASTGRILCRTNPQRQQFFCRIGRRQPRLKSL